MASGQRSMKMASADGKVSTAKKGHLPLPFTRGPFRESRAESTDSGFHSLHSKSEEDIKKMLTNDMKDPQTFSAWVKEKLSGREDGTTIEGKNFVGALLTDIGGNLVIRDKGVHLYVPPGAVQKQQFVYARILSPFRSSGAEYREKETCVTPIIECGPPGLTFRKKVHLTIPHCASSGKWHFTIQRGDHHLGSESWETVEYANISNANGAFTFETIHFTWFCLTGTRQQEDDGQTSDGQGEEDDQETSRDVEFKWMKPVVSMRPIGDQHEVKVQICNAEDVKELETCKSSAPRSFRVRDTKEDINVTLEVADENYHMVVSEDSQQPKIIPFQNLWSNYLLERHNGGPSVVFNIEASQICLPNSADIYQPRFKLTICQGTGIIPMEVQVLEIMDILTEESTEPQDSSQEVFFSRQPYYDPVDPTTLRFLDDSTFRKLCVILDGNNTTGRGWEALAPLVGLKEFYVVTGIKCIAEGEKKSPSVITLDNFFKNHASCDICETLKKLSNNLRDIDNHDARDLVEKAIMEKEDLNSLEAKTLEDVKDIENPMNKNEQLSKDKDDLRNQLRHQVALDKQFSEEERRDSGIEIKINETEEIGIDVKA